MRLNNRSPKELRPVKIIPHYIAHAEGSALIEFGDTKVICTASLEDTPPKWLSGTGQGWVTAEYGMLPRSTHTRMRRDKAASGGRTQEITRLIGRSLRAGVDLNKLGERSVFVDCDVIQADGGTRTAAITGGFVALALALDTLRKDNIISTVPIRSYVAAVSVGMSSEGPLMDLDYAEDSSIDTDMNFVMTGDGKFVEVQGTAEKEPFDFDQLTSMSRLAEEGCKHLFQIQSEIIGNIAPLK